ncbi:hypothetical protein ACROYT_G020103 [Oculina patagonica]
MAEWLVERISYIYRHDYLFARAERQEPIEHEDQDQEDRYPVPCTEPNNLVYMHGLWAGIQCLVQIKTTLNTCTDHWQSGGFLFNVQSKTEVMVNWVVNFTDCKVMSDSVSPSQHASTC